jgi:hypothetical protein
MRAAKRTDNLAAALEVEKEIPANTMRKLNVFVLVIIGINLLAAGLRTSRV